MENLNYSKTVTVDNCNNINVLIKEIHEQHYSYTCTKGIVNMFQMFNYLQVCIISSSSVRVMIIYQKYILLLLGVC